MVDPKKPYGLVLAGGGGKGAYQIGVWKALCEMGIAEQIGVISGASVGGLNAVLIADGDLAKAERIWKEISPLQFMDVEPDEPGMYSREGLLTLIEENFHLEQFKERGPAIFVDACRKSDEKCRYFLLNNKSTEDMKALLLATSALPGVYPPVTFQGEEYIDGGVQDNLPIRPLYEKGYRKLITITLSDHAVVPKEQYPGAEFLCFSPSVSIGDFFDGTLDFAAEGAKSRLELGYRDGIRVLSAYAIG